MRRIINILVFIPILIIGCNKSNKIQTINEDIEDVSVHISTEIQEQENLSIIMYVNSLEGLRVRNLPGINGDRIGFLDYLTEVKIIKENNEIVNIEGIEGKWVNIITPIEGWIFNGFLENEEQYKNRLNKTIQEKIVGEWFSNKDGFFEFSYNYQYAFENGGWVRFGIWKYENGQIIIKHKEREDEIYDVRYIDDDTLILFDINENTFPLDPSNRTRELKRYNRE